MWTASNNIYWLSNITGGNGQSYLLPINNSHCQAQTVFVSSKKLCCCNLFDRDQSPNTVMATFFPRPGQTPPANQSCYYVLAPRRSQQQHTAQKAEVARSEVTFHLQQGRHHNTSNTRHLSWKHTVQWERINQLEKIQMFLIEITASLSAVLRA